MLHKADSFVSQLTLLYFAMMFFDISNKQVRQQDTHMVNVGGGSYNYVQQAAPFSRSRSPPRIACLYLAYSKLQCQKTGLLTLK